MIEDSITRIGSRVYVPEEASDWPLGVGTIVDDDPDFRRGDGFVAIRLDEPAKRHESDGEPRSDWFVRKSALLPAGKA